MEGKLILPAFDKQVDNYTHLQICIEVVNKAVICTIFCDIYYLIFSLCHVILH